MEEVTGEQVLRKLATDDGYAVNCLMQLYRCQTADEQASEATRELNGVGFNAVDAFILSDFARQVQAWKDTPPDRRRYATPLSAKQMVLLRRKLPTYCRQLTALTNAALARKGTPPPPTEPPPPAPEPVDTTAIDRDDTAGDAARLEAERVELSYLAEHLPARNGFDVDLSPRQQVVARLGSSTVATDGLGTVNMPPSCRLVEDGGGLRWPTAREMDKAACDRQLQRATVAAVADGSDPFAVIGHLSPCLGHDGDGEGLGV